MKPTDRRLRDQLAPARGLLVAVGACGLVSGLLVIAQAWAVAGLVIAVLDDGDATRWGVGTAAVLLARGMASGLGDTLAARAAAAVSTHLRHRLLAASIESADATASGDRAVLITRGVAAIEPYLTRYLPALVMAAVLPTLTVVALATQDMLSAVIVIATLPLVPVFGALVGMATRDRAEEQWRAMASLAGHFVDVVRGLPTLVAHRRAEAQSTHIARISDSYRVATLRTLRLAFASSAVLELVATLSVALVAVTVGVRLAGGDLGLHTALVVLLLAPEAYWPLRRVGAEFHAAAEGAATVEAAQQILVAAADAAAGAAAPADADLVVHGLALGHAGRPAVTLPHATIPGRGLTVVTGPSGCGKSTLLSALAGLMPGQGTVSSGGLVVGGAARRQQVAWVAQQPMFIEGSIADNLRLARPLATDDDLWAALRRVQLAQRVADLHGGLASGLGEDGATLSAGERARLALARALVADRPWVLLDEPTAHLDDVTRQAVLDTLVDLGRHQAVVVATHDPVAIAAADRVIDLSRGTGRAPAPSPSTTPHSAAPRVALPPATGGAGRGRLAVGTVAGALATASGVALTATAGWLIVQAAARPAVLTLLVAIVGVRAFGLARPVLRYAERLLGHDAALRLLATRRAEVYDRLVPLVPGRLGRRGDLLSAVVDDVDSVVDRELRVRMPLRQFVLVAALSTAIAAAILPLAGTILAAFTTTAGGGAYLLARSGSARAERTRLTLRASVSASVLGAIQIADELRIWQATERAAAHAGNLTARSGRAGVAATRWLAAARALVMLLAGTAMTLTAAVAQDALAAGTLSRPTAALLVLLPLALVDVVLPLADSGALSARVRAAESRLQALTALTPAVLDTGTAARPATDHLSVQAASARWDTPATTTRPVTLDLHPGERVTLVGPSGCGKSTLAALLLRFLDPAEGQVERGGVGLAAMRLDDVRGSTGLVDDHPHIFGTTLVENVRLARPAATDAEVEFALRRARLGNWLDALPDGLNTWLGDGHGAVSGGERARIGLARSLLADQPVLVLDEPAAHLDHATATELAHEVLTGPRERSVLWITHGAVGRDLADRVVDLA